MFNNDLDRGFENFGKKDPYFGVISYDRFHKGKLTDRSKEEFFTSEINYIDDILEKIRQHIDPNFNIEQALNFGCGVGRLVIPLSKISQEVLGVDVSDSMLNEAKKNCEARFIDNVDFIKSDDNLSLLNGTYDFIHSYTVFQHMPVKRGERIFENLIAHLANDGVCVLHFKYGRSYKLKKSIAFMRKNVPFYRNYINLIRGSDFFAPKTQMNTYNLNHLFLLIQTVNVRNCYIEFTDHGGELGIIMYFQKKKWHNKTYPDDFYLK